MRLELGADVSPWCCSRPAVCELFPRSVLRTHPVLRALGPDLLAPPVPFHIVIRRARCSRAQNLAELLLDQRVACGLGNVYKSELLFLHGLSPRTAAPEIPDKTIEALFRDGALLLQKNLGPGRRRTRGFGPAGKIAPGEPRLWVYGRRGRSCLRCATPIAGLWMGVPPRVTYCCPRCQPAPTLRSASVRGTGMETPSRFPRV